MPTINIFFSNIYIYTTLLHSSYSSLQKAIMERFKIPERFSWKGACVWEAGMKSLVDEYKPLNLDQGYPNFAPDYLLRQSFEEALKVNTDSKRVEGHPRLVQNVARLYSNIFERNIDPWNDIIITSGGYESLFCIMLGHVDIGDEVIIIEPFFNCYEAMVRIAGGIPRFIQLKEKADTKTRHSKHWYLDEDELKSLFNEKTKVILINAPHNPTGKIFSYKELTVIADLCKKWNVLCISDEVYDWFIFDDNKFTRMATLPGMWERTLSLYSAGKAYNITGWKVGWTIGHSKLVYNLKFPKLTNRSMPAQIAVAIMIEKDMQNFRKSQLVQVSNIMEKKRNALLNSLMAIGLNPIIPEGGWFILVDWTPLRNRMDLSGESGLFEDQKVARWLVKHAGILVKPISIFCGNDYDHLGAKYIRFCFIKTDETLAEMDKHLRKAFPTKE